MSDLAQSDDPFDGIHDTASAPIFTCGFCRTRVSRLRGGWCLPCCERAAARAAERLAPRSSPAVPDGVTLDVEPGPRLAVPSRICPVDGIWLGPDPRNGIERPVERLTATASGLTWRLDRTLPGRWYAWTEDRRELRADTLEQILVAIGR